MPFFIKPFFRKPFKLFAIDADTGQPIDPNVRTRTRVTYYELAEGSNGSKKLVAHKSPSQITKEGGEEEAKAEAEAKPAEGEGSKKEGSQKEGSKKEDAPKEGSKKEGSKKEDAPKEGSKKEGSKTEDAPKEGSKKEGSKKEDAAKPEHKGDDVAWTPEEDEKLKAMKGDGKTWAQISVELGRHKGQLTVRWKEIKPPGSDDKGKMPADAKGGEGDKGKNDKEKQGGGQGKQGKKEKGKKGGDKQQNHQKKNENENKNNNDKSNQDKKESEKKASSSKKESEKPAAEASKPASKPASIKPTSKPASIKPASNKPASRTGSINETRFTMTDWLTLQEDDMFSFGELQCLSELIGKDLSQSWQRVAAKFFDLTGRRIHPDDVRDKFERMAVMAQGGK
jgi:hypothetical protein